MDLKQQFAKAFHYNAFKSSEYIISDMFQWAEK